MGQLVTNCSDARNAIRNKVLIAMTTTVYQAKLGTVTEDRLHEIMREWLQALTEEAGGPVEFARMTGIKSPQISRSLNGGQVSYRMVALISELPGMTMARVFEQLAGRSADAERLLPVQRADRAAAAAAVRQSQAAEPAPTYKKPPRVRTRRRDS